MVNHGCEWTTGEYLYDFSRNNKGGRDGCIKGKGMCSLDQKGNMGQLWRGRGILKTGRHGKLQQ